MESSYRYFFSEKGDFVSHFGEFGKENGFFQLPSALCWDSETNSLIVADAGNARIQIFSENHKHIRSIGSRGSGDGQFIDISGIAIDLKNGVIFGSDPKRGKVLAFTREGHFLYSFGEFKSPAGIAFNTPKGQLWIADSNTGDCTIWSVPNHHYEAVEWIYSPETNEEKEAKERRRGSKKKLTPQFAKEHTLDFDPTKKQHLKMTIQSAEIRHGTDLDGLSDPYTVVLLSGKPLGKTPYIKRTLKPIWNHAICFPAIPSEKPELSFQVYDHDFLLPDDLVGTAVWNLPVELPSSATLILQDPRSKQRAGQLTVRIERIKV